MTNSMKVILSACSPFFRRILLSNPHQHPLIYLTGVSKHFLTSMVWRMLRKNIATIVEFAEERLSDSIFLSRWHSCTWVKQMLHRFVILPTWPQFVNRNQHDPFKMSTEKEFLWETWTMMVNLQEDLTGFMAAASKFQIKGLSEEKVCCVIHSQTRSLELFVA